jgi:hypothetical protein
MIKQDTNSTRLGFRHAGDAAELDGARQRKKLGSVVDAIRTPLERGCLKAYLA